MKITYVLTLGATACCLLSLHVGCRESSVQASGDQTQLVSDSDDAATCECCQEGHEEDWKFGKKPPESSQHEDHEEHDLHDEHGHDDHDHDHDHEHAHAHVPADKPISFSAGIQRIDNWLLDDTLVSLHHEQALRVLRWLPELALESDLPKEDWLVIYNHCVALQEGKSKDLTQWRSFVDDMFDYRLDPTLIRPVVDGRDWH